MPHSLHPSPDLVRSKGSQETHTDDRTGPTGKCQNKENEKRKWKEAEEADLKP